MLPEMVVKESQMRNCRKRIACDMETFAQRGLLYCK